MTSPHFADNEQSHIVEYLVKRYRNGEVCPIFSIPFLSHFSSFLLIQNSSIVQNVSS